MSSVTCTLTSRGLFLNRGDFNDSVLDTFNELINDFNLADRDRIFEYVKDAIDNTFFNHASKLGNRVPLLLLWLSLAAFSSLCHVKWKLHYQEKQFCSPFYWDYVNSKIIALLLQITKKWDVDIFSKFCKWGNKIALNRLKNNYIIAFWYNRHWIWHP